MTKYLNLFTFSIFAIALAAASISGHAHAQQDFVSPAGKVQFKSEANKKKAFVGAVIRYLRDGDIGSAGVVMTCTQAKLPSWEVVFAVGSGHGPISTTNADFSMQLGKEVRSIPIEFSTNGIAVTVKGAPATDLVKQLFRNVKASTGVALLILHSKFSFGFDPKEIVPLMQVAANWCDRGSAPTPKPAETGA